MYGVAAATYMERAVSLEWNAGMIKVSLGIGMGMGVMEEEGNGSLSGRGSMGWGGRTQAADRRTQLWGGNMGTAGMLCWDLWKLVFIYCKCHFILEY